MSELLLERTVSPAETDISATTSAVAYEQLISPEGVSHFAEKIAQESGELDFEFEEAVLGTSKNNLQARFHTIDRDQSLSDAQSEEQKLATGAELNNLGVQKMALDKLRNFNTIRMKDWERNGTMLFDAAEDDIRPLVEGLEADAKTEETEFLPEDFFASSIDDEKRKVEIDATQRPIEVPLSSIISATGFESWEKGRTDGDTKGRRTSREVIEDYSTLDTEIPPVDSAEALILPNGKVVLRTHNAHRVAAAKLKGQKTIQVKHLSVRQARYQVVD